MFDRLRRRIRTSENQPPGLDLKLKMTTHQEAVKEALLATINIELLSIVFFTSQSWGNALPTQAKKDLLKNVIDFFKADERVRFNQLPNELKKAIIVLYQLDGDEKSLADQPEIKQLLVELEIMLAELNSQQDSNRNR